MKNGGFDKRLAALVASCHPEQCWPAPYALNMHGYAVVMVKNEAGKWIHIQGHRLVYLRLVGPIPDGLVLDHLCRNRACWNPAHLEPVTFVENLMRGESPHARKKRQTHCKHGHAFSPENTKIVVRDGTRKCRACIRRLANEKSRRDKLKRVA